MVKLLRCRVCGFVIKENKLKDNCPACGYPSSVFEPYEEEISEERKRILNLDLHPILVHFPEASSTIIFLLALITLIAPTFFRSYILGTIIILSLLLPFFTVIGILSGLIDGKVRLKKLKTPLLIRKIIIGSTFVILAILLILPSYVFGNIEENLIYIFILSLGCLICGTFLGLIGKKLTRTLIRK